MARKHRTSTNSDRHPYMRLSTWQNNQFWETAMYTEKAKEYFRNWLAEMREREIRYVNL